MFWTRWAMMSRKPPVASTNRSINALKGRKAGKDETAEAHIHWFDPRSELAYFCLQALVRWTFERSLVQPLKDAWRAGAPEALDVSIRRKVYRSASGVHIEVLTDLQFQAHPGEALAIMGPSGCGKSTLLRMIAGLDGDYEGHIERSGAGRMGMVFQEPTLLNWRSVEENIRLVMQEDEERESILNGILDRMELTAHRKHFPGELSVGLARRVGIGRALASLPTLLLMDEPFASLDGALAARLQDLIKHELTRRTITTLLVTHSFDEALRVADRLLVFSTRPSRIIADIKLGAELLKEPARVAAVRQQVEDVIAQNP
jgi:NitT/TauT family transport system ATP-binding protein